MLESYPRDQRQVSARVLGSGPHCLPSSGVLQGLSGKERNHEKTKSKVEKYSLTSYWPLTGSDEVDTVSQSPSLTIARPKMVSSSVVEGHCRSTMKAKKNQGPPDQTT